jgi:hypothetical protein
MTEQYGNWRVVHLLKEMQAEMRERFEKAAGDRTRMHEELSANIIELSNAIRRISESLRRG